VVQSLEKLTVTQSINPLELWNLKVHYQPTTGPYPEPVEFSQHLLLLRSPLQDHLINMGSSNINRTHPLQCRFLCKRKSLYW